MLKTRIYQLQLAQRDIKFGRKQKPKSLAYYYWDRSMIGDYIFALWYVARKKDSRDEARAWALGRRDGERSASHWITCLNSVYLPVFAPAAAPDMSPSSLQEPLVGQHYQGRIASI
jgi:hypothetical protein